MVAKEMRDPPPDGPRRPIPFHPPYALMIREAIRSLKEEGGSTEASISDYILANFDGLPWAHDRFLPYYLNKLTLDGEFVRSDDGRFRVADDDDAVAEAHEPEPLAEPGHKPPKKIAESQEVSEAGGANPVADNNVAYAPEIGPKESNGVSVNGDAEVANPLVEETLQSQAAIAVCEEESRQAENDVTINGNVAVVLSREESGPAAESDSTAAMIVGVEQGKGAEDCDAAIDGNAVDEPVPAPSQAENDDEGVPIACEGDLIFEIEPPTAISESLMETGEAESAAKMNDGGEGPASVPKRRGRPPKRRGEYGTVDGDPKVIQVVCTNDNGGNNHSMAVSKTICPYGRDAEPLQNIPPHEEPGNVDGVEKELALAQTELTSGNKHDDTCSASVPKKLGRPPKRKRSTIDNPKDAIVTEPLQTVPPHEEPGNVDGAAKGLALAQSEPMSGKKHDDDARSASVPKKLGRPPKRKHSSIDSPKEAIVAEPLQTVPSHEELVNVDGAEKELALAQSEPMSGNKHDDDSRSVLVPKKLGRPPKRKHSSIDSPKDAIVAGRNLDLVVSVDPSSLAFNGTTAEPEVPEEGDTLAEEKQEDGSNQVPKRRGRPPKRENKSAKSYEDDGDGKPPKKDGSLVVQYEPMSIDADLPKHIGWRSESKGDSGFKGNQDNKSNIDSRRRGRPPKMKPGSVDNSKNRRVHTRDVEPPKKENSYESAHKSKKNIDNGDDFSITRMEIKSPTDGLLKCRGRPPKSKPGLVSFVEKTNEKKSKFVVKTIEKIAKENSSVPKRLGRPPKPKPAT